jgi:hypothetical protein
MGKRRPVYTFVFVRKSESLRIASHGVRAGPRIVAALERVATNPTRRDGAWLCDERGSPRLESALDRRRSSSERRDLSALRYSRSYAFAHDAFEKYVIII